MRTVMSSKGTDLAGKSSASEALQRLGSRVEKSPYRVVPSAASCGFSRPLRAARIQRRYREASFTRSARIPQCAQAMAAEASWRAGIGRPVGGLGIERRNMRRAHSHVPRDWERKRAGSAAISSRTNRSTPIGMRKARSLATFETNSEPFRPRTPKLIG